MQRNIGGLFPPSHGGRYRNWQGCQRLRVLALRFGQPYHDVEPAVALEHLAGNSATLRDSDRLLHIIDG